MCFAEQRRIIARRGRLWCSEAVRSSKCADRTTTANNSLPSFTLDLSDERRDSDHRHDRKIIRLSMLLPRFASNRHFSLRVPNDATEMPWRSRSRSAESLESRLCLVLIESSLYYEKSYMICRRFAKRERKNVCSFESCRSSSFLSLCHFVSGHRSNRDLPYPICLIFV